VLTVIARRPQAPWALAFRLYVYLAMFILVLRIGFRVLFGAEGPTVILRVPTLRLPGPLSAVQLLGPISAEGLLAASQSALQLATMILAIGAANSLANPKRLLAAVPGALYEWGTVVVIALSVFPQLAESLVRVQKARQLRAETGKGAHLIRNVAMPVLSDALDRSLLLAGAMDSRGYGRNSQVSPGARVLTATLLIVSSFALCLGAFALLDTGNMPTWLGLPMVLIGLVVGLVGLRLSGRRVSRTRYRPDPMALPEWLVLGSGVSASLAIIIVAAQYPQVADPPAQPLAWPPVNGAALAAILILIIPVILAPAPAPPTSYRTPNYPDNWAGVAPSQNVSNRTDPGDTFGQNVSNRTDPGDTGPLVELLRGGS